MARAVETVETYGFFGVCFVQAHMRGPVKSARRRGHTPAVKAIRARCTAHTRLYYHFHCDTTCVSTV